MGIREGKSDDSREIHGNPMICSEAARKLEESRKRRAAMMTQALQTQMVSGYSQILQILSELCAVFRKISKDHVPRRRKRSQKKSRKKMCRSSVEVLQITRCDGHDECLTLFDLANSSRSFPFQTALAYFTLHFLPLAPDSFHPICSKSFGSQQHR